MAPTPIPLEERIQRSIEIDADGCWIWQLYRNGQGYGWITVRDVNRPAHRVAYETFVGPIPDGLELDHLCRVRACVNPAHLEPVTHAENMRRGMAPGVVARRTGVCQRGHALTGYNVMQRSDGHVQCRECHRAARRRYKARTKKAA
ncbi:HNH endonuclease signature motif containing protein [Nocardia wallacei]|uniref:HNH endonuclease signature motif containing protein n=1 Tax=Nocardia wallacei TaxID=480035 RepID=UPI002456A1EF|nr:HNH endonuclease signature motif containing protein [Nocardia wallacei]